MSVVYFIRQTNTALVKIGRSRHLKRRLTSIRTSNSNEIEVIRTVAGGNAVENWFHQHFRHSRFRGEWFEFCPEMLTVLPPADLSKDDAVASKLEEDAADAVLGAYAGATSILITREQYRDALLGVIVREFGKRRNATKQLAQLAECSPRTAEKWLAGTVLPRGVHLLNLMARCEAVDAEMARLKALARGEG